MVDEEGIENGDVTVMEKDKGNVKAWWKSRSKNEKKCAVCLLGLAITVLLGLAVYFCMFADKTVICKTRDCHHAAAEIQKYIEPRYKPCDDFYRFACGNFLQNNSDDTFSSQSVKLNMQNEIQSDINKMLQEEIDQEDIASFNVAKKFYRACMNEQAIESVGIPKLAEILEKIGGWPLLHGDEWDGENYQWTNAVRNLRLIGVNFDFFFNITVDVDVEKPDSYILGIHDRFFSPSEISANSKEIFLDYMVEVASQFKTRTRDVRAEQENVLNFILSLGKISEESKNKTSLYNLFTVDELNKEFPSINWAYLLQDVLLSIRLRGNDNINVADPHYLKNLEILLSRTSNRVKANFVAWQVIQSLINYLPSRVLDRAYEYLTKVNGQFYRKPRWSVCVEATRERLSGPINLAYIERHFSEETHRNVTDLIRNVKEQFRENLRIMSWLDEDTKRRINKMLVTSLDKIYTYMEYRQAILDNSIYEMIKISKDHLLQAVLDLDKMNWNLHYNKLRQSVQDHWINSQTFISGLNVIYSAHDNVLKFPLGLFRGIYFNDKRPDYMNYGLLGSIVAHQISHIFMEAEGVNVAQSRMAEQKLINWWSPDSLQNYVDKIECLARQYAGFRLKEVKDNIQTNPLITRDEDMADLAGFKLAYDTYLEKEWRLGRDPILPGLKYTARQLFWISSALQFCSKYPIRYLKDKYAGNKYHHSPNEFRVNGPLRNLDEFARDFKCSSVSYMNPVNKCYIW